MQPTAAPASRSLAERLRGVRVDVRDDLVVSRDVFQRTPAYVVRDPITFQSHRLSPQDYRIFCQIEAGYTLGELFEKLTSEGLLQRADEEQFYQFVFMLHRLAFLNLPVSDEALLYKRYAAKKKARVARRWTSILFLQIPLFDPDLFLQRTLPLLAWLFTRTALAGWCVLVAAALTVLGSRAGDVHQPLDSILNPANLPGLWLTLIALKTMHEFGHAYACRKFGGHVPAMGVYFILFTPCAYVDATAAWGFPNKWNRLVVSLAGMYVESIAASVAVFVWAFTDPGLLHSVAYNAMLTASIVTVLFNINPLMRYDGYYILADLIEIPNLRQKAAQTFASAAKRLFLGLRTSPPAAGRLARSFLLAFGVASLGYRALLLIGIGAALAYKCGFIGLLAACFYVAVAVIGAIKKLLRYLWKDEETAPRRKRAVACGVCTIVGLPLALLAAPSSPNVFAPAVVAAEKQATVRTDVPGFIERIGVEIGQFVRSGDLIAWLGDDDAQIAVRQAECDVEKSQLIIEANLAADPAAAAAESELLSQYERVAQKSRADLAALSVRAPFEGRVVQSIRRNDIGRFLHKGEPLATIINGRWQAQILLSEHEFASVQPRFDGRVWFRSSLDPTREFRGRIVTVEPGGARVIQEIGLTQLAGAGIAVDPLTNSAERPFFRVTVELEAGPNELQLGQTGSARFRGEWEPLGVNLIRSVLRFSNRILAG